METERITLNQRERDRLRVLHEIKGQHISQIEAAERGITAAQLAHRLRGFGAGPWGLRTRKTRLDASKTAQRWHRADFADAWSRYVTADPEQPEQTNESGAQPAVPSPEHPRTVPGQEIAIQPMLTGLVPGVPAAKGENGNDGDDRWTL